MNTKQNIIQISHGAEAVLFLDTDKQEVIKHRKEKTYRHPEIDRSLRQFRTRREAKILARLAELSFNAPRLAGSCDKDMKISMQFIDGERLKDTLHKNHIAFSKEIGKMIAVLHDNDIIHGDLTTSNMILDKKDSRIYFIDFGLGSFSEKAEDKAVDLHLFRRALDSKHPNIAEECFNAALEGYKKGCNAKNAGLVLERLKMVESRGKNKKKCQ